MPTTKVAILLAVATTFVVLGYEVRARTPDIHETKSADTLSESPTAGAEGHDKILRAADTITRETDEERAPVLPEKMKTWIDRLLERGHYEEIRTKLDKLNYAVHDEDWELTIQHIDEQLSKKEASLKRKLDEFYENLESPDDVKNILNIPDDNPKSWKRRHMETYVQDLIDKETAIYEANAQYWLDERRPPLEFLNLLDRTGIETAPWKDNIFDEFVIRYAAKAVDLDADQLPQLKTWLKEMKTWNEASASLNQPKREDTMPFAEVVRAKLEVMWEMVHNYEMLKQWKRQGYKPEEILELHLEELHGNDKNRYYSEYNEAWTDYPTPSNLAARTD